LFRDRLLLCNPAWPWIWSPALPSKVLGLQACIAMPGREYILHVLPHKKNFKSYVKYVRWKMFIGYIYHFTVYGYIKPSHYTPQICIFFIFGGTGVWTQCFVLAKQVLNCLSHTSSPMSFLFVNYTSIKLGKNKDLEWQAKMQNKPNWRNCLQIYIYHSINTSDVKSPYKIREEK
jgi:hypothetical protein